MTLYAHDWEILKGDRIPRWDHPEYGKGASKDKRSIDVDVFSWIGTSLGATHWYLRIREEQNQWWCEDQNTWVSLSCDTKGARRLEADLDSKKACLDLLHTVLPIIFGKTYKRTHRVNMDTGE